MKYWVTGFSRAAAVANLVAGYLTDNGSTYKTQQRDVFGYTWECPQAAKKQANDANALNYKNIHNIINPMDAVPKVSPDAFEHERLGVDYQMPYHGNVSSTSQNTALYNQMYEVLKTIAVGNGSDEDPLIETVNPSNYPYNKVMTIYKMDGSDLMGQVVNYALGRDTETLMKEFGTVEAEQEHKGGLFNAFTYGNVGSLLGWNGGSDYKTTTWYLDDFINSLVTVFLTSNAWVGGTGNGRTALQNRATFISNYQSDFRTLFGYFLDFTGPAFLGMVPKLIDAVTSNIGTSLTSGFAWYFIRFYNDPSNTSKKNNLISASKTLAVDVANDMVSGFPDPEYQGITKAQMNAAMQNLAELVINLYSYELSEYDSQYLGTTLRYLNTILCTHEQETVMSWIMSLDPNHMNRSARTITIPAGCDATLYLFREQYGETPTDDTTAAPVVAELKDGTLVSKDDRITYYTSNGSNVIRYPASLEIRTDIKPKQTLNLNQISVGDYQTKNAYISVSDGDSQFNNAPSGSTYKTITQNTNLTNAAAKNTDLSSYGSIEPGDTLHVRVNDMEKYNSSGTSYELCVDKAPTAVVTDFAPISMPAVGATTPFGGVKQEQSTQTVNGIRTRQTVNTVPSANIYYDDDIPADIVTNGSGNNSAVQANANEPELGKGQYSFTFTGTGIDVYCTTYDKITVDGKEVPAGYVQAKLDNDPQQIVTMRTQSDETRYNVPVISFTGLENRQHTLTLNILGSSHFKFDGVRIYNSVKDQTLYEGTNEQYAAFVNLRKALVNNTNYSYAITDDMTDDAIGALFVDNSANLVQPVKQTDDDGNVTYENVYANKFEAYAANSPKNEIYLAPQGAEISTVTFDETTGETTTATTTAATGQSIMFTLSPSAKTGSLWLGLSAPDAGRNTGEVTVTTGGNTQTIPVTSAVDMYYRITLTPGDSILIQNTGESLISVTNLKITGVPDIYNAAQASADSSAGVTALNEAVFAPLTMQAIRAAANGGVDPEAVTAPDAEPEPEATEKPGWNDDANAVPSLLKTLFALLKQSLNDPFGGLGGW